MPSDIPPEFPPELTAGSAPSRGPERSRPYAALLALVIGVVSTVLTTGTAATVYVASSAARPTPGGEARVTFFPTTAHRKEREVEALLDSLIAPLGVLAPMDSGTMRLGVALLRARQSTSGWIPFDSTAARTLDTLAFVRRWARTERLPAFWGMKPGFAGVESASGLPLHTYYPLRRFMALNEASADSALLAGDAETAMTHARETLAAGRHLLGQTNMIDLLMARAIIHKGAALLVRSAQQGDDPMTAGAARRLDAMATGAFTVDREQLLVYRTLGSDPVDGRLLALAADTILHPALRLHTFTGLMSGACAHPREVLFGMTGERRMAFQQIAQAIEDLPRARDLVTLYQRDFDYFEDGLPPTWTRSRGTSRGTLSVLSWIVPRVVKDRVELCRWM